MMHWEKLGHIFQFSESAFKDRFISHAQSPQALELEDRIRVFFSTREQDKPGNFISHVQYVDFDPKFKKILGFSDHQVLAPGKLGCFDEHGTFPLSPVKVGDKVYGYTNGISRRVSVAVETGVGLVVSSDDGRTFERLGDGPLFGPLLNEPFMVGDPFVRQFDNEFYMFYIFGTKWSEETKGQASERVYKIGQAVSNDGLEWKRDSRQIIVDKIDENECQALPTVIKINDRYHMYFCYRGMTGFRRGGKNGYRIGYAYSDNLVDWTRDDQRAGIDLSDDGWDSEMMCYPNIFETHNGIYLLYNGNNFGKDGFGIAKLTDGN